MAQGHQESLALFHAKPIDTSIDKIEYVEYRPVSVINRNNVIEFNILEMDLIILICVQQNYM